MAIQYCIKGKYPVFLTFAKQTAVIEALEANGAISYEDFCQMDFSPATTKRINKQVKKYLADLYLTDPNEYTNRYYSFSCVGDEARDNLFRLLDAAGALYRWYGFIPGGSSFDVRFPCGKKYWLVRRSIFPSRQVLVYIDTDMVESFRGNLHSFDINQNDGTLIRMEKGQLQIVPR